MALPQRIRQSVRQQAGHMLETGQRFQRFDQIRQRHFWSTYYFTPDANGYIASNRFPVFVTPSGQNGQGFPSGVSLTDRETNWKSSNRVADNQNLEITEIGVSLGMVTPDVWTPVLAGTGLGTDSPVYRAVPAKVASEFLNNTLVSITYLTNSVPLGLASDFGQASAPQPGDNAQEALAFFRSNGFPAPSLRRKMKIPILLQHGETFSFAFELPRSIFIGLPTVTVGQDTTLTGVSPFVARLDFWATESFVEKS